MLQFRLLQLLFLSAMAAVAQEAVSGIAALYRDRRLILLRPETENGPG